MKVIKGSKVTLSYEGTFDDGTIFDSSAHGDHEHPLTFEAGAGEVVPGFDSAVLGMEEGQEKKFTIPPKEAYGEHKPELEKEIPKKDMGLGQEPKEGMVLMMSTPQGQQIPLKITKVTKNSVTVDLNHPLAGKTLHFKIKIIKIG